MAEKNAADPETVFHKIIKHQIPADIVYEDDQVVAFRDVAPVSPSHLLIVPRRTLPKLDDAKAGDKEVLGHMLLTAANLARKLGISESGYRVVINNGAGAGQSVFQLHLHLLGGRSFSWPPG